MIIGIDYTAALKQGGGIGRYTRGLITTLAQLDKQTEYRLLTSSDAPIDNLNPFQKYSNFSYKSYPFPERWMTIGWHRLYLPISVEWFAGQIDLFHSPNFILPPVRRAKTLLTVHDLSFIRHPQGAVASLRDWLNKVVPRSLARADHILADSESTKTDLFDIYNISPNRVTVVGAGVEERFHPVTEQAILKRVAKSYKLPKKFILGLGTLEPRKNFRGLIEAFSTSAVSKTHHLIIAGGKGWLYDDIFTAAENSPVKKQIQLIGFVDDADLPALYTLADIFAYPSHYEGFGIPVVEAMACGTPVVCANNSSLPEVAGQAAVQVNATDTDMLAEALYMLATNRDRHIQAMNSGFLQAQKFSWLTAAKRLRTVYQQLLNIANN
ncbi:glycosyltransferase family 1 protein [Anaerolineales bacterium HSG24]|nr:glycosyltransferase family 1 protein [Anaerolineales bacterium HSG24]